MHRHLFSFLTTLYLLLLIAVAALWARGYWTSDLLGWIAVRGDGGRVAVWLCCGRGGIGLTVTSLQWGVIPGRGGDWQQHEPQYGGADWHQFTRGGLGFYAGGANKPIPGVRSVGVCLPAPVLLLAAAVPPALYVRRRRRRNPGSCAQCGYDLTGNLSGVCPECGQTRFARAPRTPNA